MKLGVKWFWDAEAVGGGGVGGGGGRGWERDYDNQENQKRLLELSRTRNAVWMKSFLRRVER